jgi:hypothetical protein
MWILNLKKKNLNDYVRMLLQVYKTTTTTEDEGISKAL